MNITVYLGANEGNDPSLRKAVRELGTWIGESGNRLVYGGSKSGLMGEIAESVLQAGGEVTGVEPQFFIDMEYQYDAITELIVTKDMSERKTKMIELGDVFIAFPGGTGTLEEISEVMSKVSLKHLDAPCILYNLNGYYDSLKASQEKNLINLQEYLKKENVAYADLYGMLSEQQEILYHKRDSHWNNKGASMAAETLLSSLKKEHISYQDEPYTVKTDFTGDLDEMLYPLAVTPEEEIYYDKQTTFAYVGEVGSNFDPRITTVNPVKSGSLVMFRDSFGNALLPFMADAYANAYFSRGVPYQMSEVDQKNADTVIVERAERFLPEMAQSPPVMESPKRQVTVSEEESASDGVYAVESEMQGTFRKITGRIEKKYLDTESRIYVRVNQDKIYEAFPMDISTEDGKENNNGFCLYLDGTLLGTDGNQIEILTGKDDSAHVIGELTL